MAESAPAFYFYRVAAGLLPSAAAPTSTQQRRGAARLPKRVEKMSRDPGAAVAAAAAADPSKAQHGALREWAQQYSVETEPLGRGSFASVSD